MLVLRGGQKLVNLKTFKLPYGKHMLCGDVYGTGKQTVVLHGAGNSSRSVFSRLRHILNTYSIPSVSFDFIGHGETGGELLGSSLHERTKQATAVIKHKCIEPVTLISASMSGYTAIKLTDKFSVSNLILLVPAVYSTQAYNLPFGHEFSAAIRTPKSWKDSDAFEILSRFKGNLVVIAAEFDDVIPREIIVQIHSAAKNAANRILHVISGSTHTDLFPREQDFLLAMEIIIGACLNEWEAKRLESKTLL
jgi:pimeloyl-ACP methyl ester carboxylesterase